MSKEMALSERLSAVVEEYEVSVEVGCLEETQRLWSRLLRLLREMGVNLWEDRQHVLARHGLKSAVEEIRAGRVRAYSIDAKGSIRCHALPLVP